MSECVFCDALREGSRVVAQSKHWFVIYDNFPVRTGHALIMPKRHQSGLRSLTVWEWADLLIIIRKTFAMIDEAFNPDAYNVGINLGKAAGQTVFHLHIHIIPRRNGDVDGDPRGGIRNFLKADVEYP